MFLKKHVTENENYNVKKREEMQWIGGYDDGPEGSQKSE